MVSPSNLPKHIGIIMDGNGRWANLRGQDRFWGHVQGARTARKIIEHAAKIGVSYLTLYTFSTENWYRPIKEISFLMKLLKKHLKKEQQIFKDHNIRFTCIGDIKRLPSDVQEVINETIDLTANNTGMTLSFALSYGGKQEITSAVKDIAYRVKNGVLDIGQIDESLITNFLQSSFLPEPDLIIRTSGEQRLSNFFTWQAAYSELYFTDVSWPQFDTDDFDKAILFYTQRERRFGRIKPPQKVQSNISL